ncbi:two-component system sensor histidine kinase NtrB [Rubinisphaera margarita]|uniref:two-component system sensor histidine kinase NtrB n=1 Tax=Rubinisphaera margarita TaxID=2909586 RepID=UPI001EE910A7|nr:ATP-binding protein [Rubinisphaera margarita]MCG6155166.1 PAS domain S-box protein [Rubinisphaera margarita]
MSVPTPTPEELLQQNRQLRRQVVDLTAAVGRLKETSDLYRIVADTAADAILCVDEQGEIIYANPSSKTLLGYSPASLIGKSLFNLVSEEHRAIPKQAVESFLSTGEEPGNWSGMELDVISSDGTPVPVEVSFGEVRGEDGHYRFSGYLRDLRPRRKLEEQARERLSALAHANRLKSVGELASGLAHELNQPLSAICLYADLALTQARELTEDSAPLLDGLETIVTQAQRAAEIISILRELIRKNEPRRQPIDLNAAVQAVLHLLKSELETRRIQVTVQLSDEDPQIDADRTQVEQIVLNLLQNAMDAMEDVIPAQRTIQIISQVNDDLVELQIVDSGCGLPEDGEQQVFENFFTTKAQGIGIGLGICRSIAEMHRGRILAENASPQGARFTLQLPRHQDESGETA